VAFSVLLACVSSSLAVFREATLEVWEQMPDSTLWREKNGVEGEKNGEGRKMRREKGGGGVGEGRETEDGKHNKKIELSKPFFGAMAV